MRLSKFLSFYFLYIWHITEHFNTFHQSYLHIQYIYIAKYVNLSRHMAEHMDIPMDTSKMSEQELQFHYFKVSFF